VYVAYDAQSAHSDDEAIVLTASNSAIFLNAGDTLEVFVDDNHAGELSVSGNATHSYTWFSVAKVE